MIFFLPSFAAWVYIPLHTGLGKHISVYFSVADKVSVGKGLCLVTVGGHGALVVGGEDGRDMRQLLTLHLLSGDRWMLVPYSLFLFI